MKAKGRVAQCVPVHAPRLFVLWGLGCVPLIAKAAYIIYTLPQLFTSHARLGVLCKMEAVQTSPALLHSMRTQPPCSCLEHVLYSCMHRQSSILYAHTRTCAPKWHLMWWRPGASGCTVCISGSARHSSWGLLPAACCRALPSW